ncbi:hypothetical protein NFC81_08550 [Salinispirillum sp. LH 10-3-1]|uniref:Uncharacterized protein n=1 Tax=Salinispirillum sp. LH 10-3-1 TaxID=2952525 RepID=A0AB38YBP3_9GAMM
MLLLIVAAAVLSGAIAYSVFPWLRHFYTDAPLWVAQAPDSCDLHQSSCRVTVPGGWVELSLSPNPIELLTPLSVQVTTSGVSSAGVQVDFSSPDMYMGYNRPTLQATENHGEYVGATSLAICILETMTWEARVLLEQPDGVGAVSFFFTTTRRF